MEFTIYEEVEVHGRFYILVHARFASSDDYDIHDSVWNRPDFDKPCFSGSKYIVVGHTPTLGITGEPEIVYKNNYITIDCGAGFEGGKLSCLCLNTMEEYYV